MIDRFLRWPALAGLSLFIGVVICGLAGGASGAAIAAPVVCRNGKFAIEDYVNINGRSGQSLFCVSPNGDRVDVSIPAIAISGLFYSTMIFPVLWVGARYYQVRRARTGASLPAITTPAAPGPASPAGAPADRGAPAAPPIPRAPAPPAAAGKVSLAEAAAQLNRLKDLRDSGAITAEEFEVQRAEILANL